MKNYKVWIQCGTQREIFRYVINVEAENSTQAEYIAIGYITSEERRKKNRYLRFDSVLCEVDNEAIRD